MTAPEDGPAYDLKMPFVVCQSQGGAYDDAAFVAGYEAAFISCTLDVLQKVGGSFERWVSPALVPQLDLIAMEYGYKVSTRPWDEHPEEWVHAHFQPAGDEPADAP